MTDPELHLYGAEVREVAEAIELMLRFRRRNGYAPRGERSRVAAKAALAVPLVAACLPALLDAAGPQAAAAARAQASGTAASATAARPALLGASEAARSAGVSAQAVRAACAAGRLAASKHKVSGEWVIHVADLAAWVRSRDAA